MERSKKLNRQFKKILNAEDLELRLQAIAGILRQQGAEAYAEHIELLEKVPNLFDSIDKSYAEYDEQIKLTSHNLERSSAELNGTNTKLEKLNLAIAAMMDAMEQGLFSFGPDGICSDAYSRASVTLLGKKPAGGSFMDVLNLPADFHESARNLLAMVFAPGFCPAFLEDYLDLLPRKFDGPKDKSVYLEYRPILDKEGAIQSILTVATDRSNIEAAEKLSREREDSAMMILRMSENRNLFTRFYQSAHIFFCSFSNSIVERESLEQLKRDIHTLKGNAALFFLRPLVDELHELETKLATTDSIDGASGLILTVLPKLRHELAAVKKQATTIFGESFDRQGPMRLVPYDLLRSFAIEMKGNPSSQALTDRFIAFILGEPIRKELAAFDIILQETADRYGQKVQPCVFTGENFQIINENYDKLFESFVHISRNIVAHAIESPEVREQWHKPPYLSVTIHTERFERMGEKWFRVTFTDDGCGINSQALRVKLQERGDPDATAASDKEILMAIFKDNMSTREQADDLAGRGVGMGAIKHEVGRLGGQIGVESEHHRFTRIIIEVPFIWLK